MIKTEEQDFAYAQRLKEGWDKPSAFPTDEIYPFTSREEDLERYLSHIITLSYDYDKRYERPY